MASAADSPAWAGPMENPYLQGLFAPVEREIEAEALPVIGEIPSDLFGYLPRASPLFPGYGERLADLLHF